MAFGVELVARAGPALAAVLGVLALVAWAARRWPVAGRSAGTNAARLSVLTSRALDARTRLFLVRLDNSEYLLAVGGSGTTTVIAGPAAGSSDQAA